MSYPDNSNVDLSSYFDPDNQGVNDDHGGLYYCEFCKREHDHYVHDTAPDWDGTPDGPPYSLCEECGTRVYEGETCDECAAEAAGKERDINRELER